MFIEENIKLDNKVVQSISQNSQVRDENLELYKIDETNISDFKKKLIMLFKNIDIDKIKTTLIII